MSFEQLWGWKSIPFRRDTGGAGFYESEMHQEALARLELLIRDKNMGLLTGEIGSGKSTIIRRLVESLNSTQYIPMYICLSGLKPKDFYSEVLRRMGETPPFSLAKAKRMWEEQLDALRAKADKQWVIIIDEAQDMTDAMIQELRYIRNQEMDGCSLFPLLLVGQPEIRNTLRLKKYQAISQRVALSYHLSGLTPIDTANYIKHQMHLTGSAIPKFSDSAVRCIYGASQGIPRVINHLCTQALYDAANRETEVIEENDIQRVIADQERQRGATG